MPARVSHLLSLVGAASLLGMLSGSADTQASTFPARQQAEHNADRPKTILELQPFRRTSSIRISNGRSGTLTLVNLQPAINVWYLLTVAWKDENPVVTLHLENPKPKERTLLLDDSYPSGLVIVEQGHRYFCELFGAQSENGWDQATASHLPFSPFCDGRLYVRHTVIGHRTALEAATDFLRNQVWGGEQVIDLGHHLVNDRYRETGQLEEDHVADSTAVARASGPRAALIDPRYGDRSVILTNLGIRIEGAKDGASLVPGAWYAAQDSPGVYVSIVQPDLLAPDILHSYPSIVSNLDRVEASALCYLVAFDLDQFELGYARGTEHPGVGWSDRVRPQSTILALPGPDGIGSIAPLVSTGLIDPDEARRTVATFTGGFKREQGAFKFGDLARQNHGSHYGFIEDGVVFSKLEPGLATIVVFNDGSLEMKTWQDADNRRLPDVKFARQNGVPLIEFDAASKSSTPGSLVGQWGAGNWSGSEDEKLRTIRAGVALQRAGRKQFLIYSVFSDATPSAMARVFQAYQCQYAMLLDMNALEHTYMALYSRSGTHLVLQHLVKGMSQLEQSSAGELVPRFVGYPDNRDFFYVMRRGHQGE